MQFPTMMTDVAGISVTELTSQFGTPLYVYDAAKILAQINQLRDFDVIRYAQKACSNLAILDLVRRHGCLVDAVSCQEVRRALAAGFVPGKRPPEIVYTADIFDRESLQIVLEQGIEVNCGSPDMIEQYGQRARGRGITLRINPGFGHGHSQKTNTGGPQSKHGIWHEQVPECLEIAARYDLVVEGLHMHIGSGTDLKHLSHVCEAMERMARKVGPAVHSISAGGGLPVPYQEDEEAIELAPYFELWDSTRKRLQEAFGHALTLEVEPGRFLAAQSGYLLTEIRAVKRMGDNLFYLVDAGFNNLARPVLYGAYHPLAIAHQNGKATDQGRHVDVVVGGPLCESGDIFTQEAGGLVASRRLPEASVGDVMVIQNAGAYGFCMSSNYNSKPLAAEVLVHEGRASLVRRRQTFDDLIRGEVIPGEGPRGTDPNA